MDAVVFHNVEELWNLPEGERAEIIDGMWFDMASPSGTHQRIVMEVSAELRDHIRSMDGGCRVFPAPFDVYLNDDDRTCVQPDITVLCDMEKYRENGIYGAPELVIEVASKSSAGRDYGIKLFHYRMAGVKEYWIINPDTRTINTWFFAGENKMEEAGLYSFEEDAAFRLYPGLCVNMNKMLRE